MGKENNCQVSKNCIKFVHLLFSLIEDRSYPYDEARKCLEKPNNNWDSCLNELKAFLKKWNKARRLKDEEAEKIIKKAQELIDNGKFLNSIKETDIPIIERERKGNRIEQRELIGLIKSLHILSPDKFPLIDNPIAKDLGVFGNNSKLNSKLKGIKTFKHCLDNLISNYKIEKTKIKDITIYPYKFLDEFLYLSISQEKEDILRNLASYTDEEIKSCIEILFKIKKELKECIKKERTQSSQSKPQEKKERIAAI